MFRTESRGAKLNELNRETRIILAFDCTVRNLTGNHEQKDFRRHGQRRDHDQILRRPGKRRGRLHQTAATPDQFRKRPRRRRQRLDRGHHGISRTE